MAKRTDEETRSAAPTAVPLSRMLTLDEVQEILNVGKPLIYSLVKSGQLIAAQFGSRGVWRVRESDLAAYVDAAFAKTAERIAAGQIPEDQTPGEE